MQHLKQRRKDTELDHVLWPGEGVQPPASPQGSGSLLTTQTSLGSLGPSLPTTSGKMNASKQRQLRTAVLAACCAALLVLTMVLAHQNRQLRTGLMGTGGAAGDFLTTPPVLVSYSYFEKDAIQKKNLEFFLSVGFGYNSKFAAPANTDLIIVINGAECLPCVNLLPIVQQVEPLSDEVTTAWTGERLTMLKRRENEGMDFAAHNTSMDWVTRTGQRSKYAYFIFLNSSVRGPFVPHYMPPNWPWTRSYTQLFTESVGVVSSSLVCLPKVDAGGYGPKVESWAFALIPETLDLLQQAGVFNVRACKLCNDGVVVMGEYGISNVLMEHGWNLNTLMYKYKNVNWLDQRHWNCNSNAHPSRHGTYDGVSMNPLEVVFIKASWHVGEPFTSKYSDWLLAHAEGRPTTTGTFSEKLYHYAITPEAQEPHNVERCYQVV